MAAMTNAIAAMVAVTAVMTVATVAAIRLGSQSASGTGLATQRMPAHPLPVSRGNAKHAIRPSDGSSFNDAACQVLGGGVAATFGARQRAVGEGSPNGRTSQAALVRRAGAEPGHEEQNTSSQDLTRGS